MNAYTVEYIAYGALADMIAEYGAHEMPADWIRLNGFKYCSLAIGSAQFDTVYYHTMKEARADAKAFAKQENVKCVSV